MSQNQYVRWRNYEPVKSSRRASHTRYITRTQVSNDVLHALKYTNAKNTISVLAYVRYYVVRHDLGYCTKSLHTCGAPDKYAGRLIFEQVILTSNNDQQLHLSKKKGRLRVSKSFSGLQDEHLDSLWKWRSAIVDNSSVNYRSRITDNESIKNHEKSR